MKLTFTIEASCCVPDAELIPDKTELEHGIKEVLSQEMEINATVNVSNMQCE